MARKPKEGLEYYPFDVDMYSDDKMKLLRARLGIKGYAVYTLLLAKIYRSNGYWMPWGEDEALLFAEDVGGECQHSFVNDVVHESVKRGLFDADIFNKFKILTSKGIQDRYSLVVGLSKLKRPEIEPNLDCRGRSKLQKIIPSGFFSKSSEEIEKSSEEIAKSSEESTQRKGKERKEKESKGNDAHEAISDDRIYPIETVKSKFFADEQVLMDAINLHRLTKEEAEYAKALFWAERKLTDEVLTKPYSDTPRHFINWLKFNLKTIKRPQKNEGTGTKNATEHRIDEHQRIKAALERKYSGNQGS